MKKIVVIGLGPGSPRYLTREAHSCLKTGFPLYLRTLKHPAAQYYAARKSKISAFDYLDNRGYTFEQVQNKITVRLLKAVRRHGTVYYAVPGHPSGGEVTVEKLRRICPPLRIKLRVITSISFLEPMLSALKINVLDGITVHDALRIDRLKEPSHNHLIITRLYNRTLACRIRQQLMALYPKDYPVAVMRMYGKNGKQVLRMPLEKLGRNETFNHYTNLYLPPFNQCGIGDLTAIMSRLRSENGCPWDKKQTHNSLRQYLIEEAYEVVAAIDREDDHALKEELGDLLLQVVFHSQIAREENRFNFNEVIDSIVAKLIRRHPHVFSKDKAENAAQVKVLWEQIKSDERSKDKSASAITIDHALPALLKAFKLQKRAADLGFDWPCIQGPLDKAREEFAELEEAFLADNRAGIEEELGDYLFTVVNIARFLDVNPELALGKAIMKFIERFEFVMCKVAQTNRQASSFSLEELDKWWEEAKKIGKIGK